MALVLLLASQPIWSADESGSAPRLLNSRDLPGNVEPEALQRQYSALQAMQLEAIEYSYRGPVHYIKGDTGVTVSSSTAELKEGDDASELVQQFGDVLLANRGETLTVKQHYALDSSTQTLRMTQSIRGIPVIDGGVAIDYDPATKRVSVLVAQFIPDRDLPTAPRVTAQQAEQLVPEAIATAKEGSAKDVQILDGTSLGYFASAFDLTPPQLVWVVRVFISGSYERFLVNAMSGAVIDRRSESQSLTREVYDANFSAPELANGLPPAMTAGQVISDQEAFAADEAIRTADTQLRQRLPLSASLFPFYTKMVIRYLHSEPNSKHKIITNIDYLTYSPPSPTTASATAPADNSYHEYAHGISERAFGLNGDFVDGGALHEGFADIAATVADIGSRGSIAPASWLIGEGFFMNAPVGAGIRSLQRPYFDSYPAPSGDWYPHRRFLFDPEHFNSTILSHAYYLSIYGGQHSRWTATYIPDTSVPPLDFSTATGEARARQIFAAAFNDSTMFQIPSFLKLKNAAMAKALSLYGSSARTSVQMAFEAVGIGLGCSAPPAVPPAVQLEDFYCQGRYNTTWPELPGAIRYHAQIRPVNLGWAFATTISDVDVTHCFIQVPGTSYYRIRACNNCGCGPWSQETYLAFWSPCA